MVNSDGQVVLGFFLFQSKFTLRDNKHLCDWRVHFLLTADGIYEILIFSSISFKHLT